MKFLEPWYKMNYRLSSVYSEFLHFCHRDTLILTQSPSIPIPAITGSWDRPLALFLPHLPALSGSALGSGRPTSPTPYPPRRGHVGIPVLLWTRGVSVRYDCRWLPPPSTSGIYLSSLPSSPSVARITEQWCRKEESSKVVKGGRKELSLFPRPHSYSSKTGEGLIWEEGGKWKGSKKVIFSVGGTQSASPLASQAGGGRRRKHMIKPPLKFQNPRTRGTWASNPGRGTERQQGLGGLSPGLAAPQGKCQSKYVYRHEGVHGRPFLQGRGCKPITSWGRE